MNAVVFLCLVALVVVAAEEKYTDKYDNIDLDEILANKRLLVPYINCVLEKGKCNAEGKELKKNLRDALETECSKCTERQEQGATKVIVHLIKSEPDMWKELADKFDPEGKFRVKYEDKARAKGIEIPA